MPLPHEAGREWEGEALVYGRVASRAQVGQEGRAVDEVLLVLSEARK